MAIETFFPSPVGPGGVLIGPLITGSTVVSVNVTLAAGTFQSVKDLTGIDGLETLMLQHVAGTGLLQIGNFSGNDLAAADFEPPVYVPGDLFPGGPFVPGQGGWLNSGYGGGGLLEVVPDIHFGSTQALTTNFAGGENRSGNLPLNPTIQAADPFVAETDFYIDAATPAGTLLFFTLQAAVLNVRPLYVVQFDNTGALTIQDGTLNNPYPGAGTGKHRLTVAGDTLGNLSYYEDGLLIANGTRIVTWGSIASFMNFFIFSGGAPLPAGLVTIDNYRVYSGVTVASGVSIPDGTGVQWNTSIARVLAADFDIGCLTGGAGGSFQLIVTGR